jgi:hypothetical protein
MRTRGRRRIRRWTRIEAAPERFAVDFDRSKVSALQEDDNLRAARWRQVGAGYVMVSEARRAFGLPTRPADDVFLRPLSTVEAGRPAAGAAKARPLVVVRRRVHGARGE